MSKNRKATYRIPAALVGDASESQQLRRQKALDEQKRRRAQRADAARHLDLFADLTLGHSDDDVDDEPQGVVRMGISSYASFLPSSSTPALAPAETPTPTLDTHTAAGPAKKKKRKQKAKRENPTTTSKWADQCMYAELLEMSEDSPWSASEGDGGLPEDLETGWVAVAPVPIGKRCLAITDQSLGVPGVAPNTSLRSRKLGKLLMPRFPSILPPLTILDCILDENWRENGILHILDVVKWKGQDIGECETPFRFWWRDTRLDELPVSPPPSHSTHHQSSSPSSSHPPLNVYRFTYPTKFLAIPYHTDTSFAALASHIVPLARSSRSIDVRVPSVDADTESMAVDQAQGHNNLVTKSAQVRGDGLLLYVAEASYEAGTSPLSSWIPIANYESPDRMTADSPTRVASSSTDGPGPLDVFLSLVQKRLARGSRVQSHPSSSMDVEIA